MNALIAAYREGLAFAAVAVTARADGLCIKTMAQDGTLGPSESLVARWWCRRAAEAECLADSAARSFRRLRQKSSDESSLACESVTRAAHRLALQIRSDADIDEEATHAIARLDQEIETQMRSGALKSVNQSYRQYRLEASSRGERVLPYVKWMDGYKVKLMREIAANMRYL
ncbi:MAG TPA: hypothetical protein VHU22_16765 [Xanthobacteraceae bacterium]|jgi:hypothetical protein|nr:hypothetical protein [Xanthobacteraceae bacterium]